MCWEQLNQPEVSASALHLGNEKWVGVAQEQLQNKQKLENTTKIITWCDLPGIELS